MQLCLTITIMASVITASQAERAFVELGALPIVVRLAATCMGQAIVVIAAWGIVGDTAAQVELGYTSKRSIADRYARWERFHLILWAFATGLLLTFCDWPELASLVAGRFASLRAAFTLVVVLFPLCLSWAIFYDADRLIGSMSDQRGRWSRTREHMCRLVVPLAAPVLFTMVFADGIQWCLPRLPVWSCIRCLPLIVTVVLFPRIVQWAWGAKQLADGPLAGLLTATQERVGVPIRHVLVSSDERANAAICGISPLWRNVIISKGLLRLEKNCVLLVFLHELGHAKLHHGLKLAIALVVAIVGASHLIAHASWDGHTLLSDELYWGRIAVCPAMAALMLAWIGKLSRLYELQADNWAVSQPGVCTNDYVIALAAVHGGADGTSWLHPSLCERLRIVRTDRCQATREIHGRLRGSYLQFVSVAMLALAISIRQK